MIQVDGEASPVRPDLISTKMKRAGSGVVYVKKKKRRKPPSSSRIQQLTPDELQTLYGVFKEADTQSKPKALPTPKINFINPIKSNQFTHLTNPFNF